MHTAFIKVFKAIGIIGYLLTAFILASTIILLNIFGPFQAMIPLGLAIWLALTKQFALWKFILHAVLIGISYALFIFMVLNFRM